MVGETSALKNAERAKSSKVKQPVHNVAQSFTGSSAASPRAEDAAAAAADRMAGAGKTKARAQPRPAPTPSSGSHGEFPRPRGRIPKSKLTGRLQDWCSVTGRWIEPLQPAEDTTEAPSQQQPSGTQRPQVVYDDDSDSDEQKEYDGLGAGQVDRGEPAAGDKAVGDSRCDEGANEASNEPVRDEAASAAASAAASSAASSAAAPHQTSIPHLKARLRDGEAGAAGHL